ncbi:heparan-alpha-glucosaminide N-acetyltransferase domain-containing protein [Erwinia sp. D4-22]
MSDKLVQRLQAIDALRGFVILLMLLDHVRETFFLHKQLADPIDVANTDAALFISRTLAHLCAPVFVFLTGLSAALYQQKKQSRRETSLFLLKRGLVLVALELTLVNFAWTFSFPPEVLYLQVIWAIGLSMLALGGLLWLPLWAMVTLSVALVAGHNLLDNLHAASGSFWHLPWAILHERGWIEVGDTLRMRTSYPLLPWIGVIALGYCAGQLWQPSWSRAARGKVLLTSAASLLGLFVLLRLLNGYGEKPWQAGNTLSESAMAFFNITKYPPSLLFICLTLAVGLALLALFERVEMRSRALAWLAVFGSAPMFFYLLHLYVLKGLYLAAEARWGKNQGEWFGFDAVWQLWICMLLLSLLLWWPVRAFARLKQQRRDIRWLKYF